MTRDSHYDSVTSAKLATHKCLDCPTIIPRYGNRKRCSECQDKTYRQRQSKLGVARRRRKREAAKVAAP